MARPRQNTHSAKKLDHSFAIAACTLLAAYAQQPGYAQMHITGFTYGIASNGISHQQRLRQERSSASDLKITTYNSSVDAIYQRSNPEDPQIDLLRQQTITNKNSDERFNTLTFSSGLSFSVFRNNQFQSPN
jgi:hypothetical protein